MNKKTKKALWVIGTLTIMASLYSIFKGNIDYMTYFGGFIGLVLIILPLITKFRQKE